MHHPLVRPSLVALVLGIWTTGPVTATGLNDNTFVAVAVPVAHG